MNAELLHLQRRAYLMAMPELSRRYTVRDLDSFPQDRKKYELIHGELHVSPAPSVLHEMVVIRLVTRLAEYLKPLGLLDTLFGVPADISWNDETLVQPDVLVVRPEELSRQWSTVKNLRLAAEVISPSSRLRDRGDKRRLYQENEVQTYWVVDYEQAMVEVWTPNDSAPLVVTDRLHWRVTSEAPRLTIDLAELFGNFPA